MKVVGYNVTFSNAVGESFLRYFISYESLVNFSELLVTSGYCMFVVPVFE